MSAVISYAQENDLHFSEYFAVLQSSSLVERRPEDPERLKKMLRHSSLVVTARNNEGKLVGFVRCITDFAHMAYVADVATSKEVQGQGIGKELMMQIKRILGPEVMMLLLSAPKAEPFYEHIGMERSQRAFTFARER